MIGTAWLRPHIIDSGDKVMQCTLCGQSATLQYFLFMWQLQIACKICLVKLFHFSHKSIYISWDFVGCVAGCVALWVVWRCEFTVGGQLHTQLVHCHGQGERCNSGCWEGR